MFLDADVVSQAVESVSSRNVPVVSVGMSGQSRVVPSWLKVECVSSDILCFQVLWDKCFLAHAGQQEDIFFCLQLVAVTRLALLAHRGISNSSFIISEVKSQLKSGVGFFAVAC